MKEDRKFHLFAIAFLSVFALALYSNSLSNSFIFDDFPNIVSNPYIQNLKDLPHFLKGLKIYTSWYRALPTLSFAINYHFHRFDVFGYHLVNLVLHILCGVLVYFISRSLITLRLKKERLSSDKDLKPEYTKVNLLSLFTATIFISHPIQVNTVTYVVERIEGLVSFFYLLSFFLFIKMNDSKGSVKKLYWGGIVTTFLLATLSKEISFTLPVTLILFDLIFVCKKREQVRNRLKIYIGVIFPLIFFVLFFFKGGIFTILFRQTHLWTPWENLLTQMNVIIQYFRLLFLPLPKWLNVDHDFQISKSLLEYPTVISALVILLLFIFAIFWMKKNRLISFSIFFFFIVLAPTSSLIPIWDVMVEYRLYLPIFSYALLLSLGAHYLSSVLARHYSKRLSQAIVLGASALLLVFYSFGTIERNRVFADDLTFWSDAAKKSPDKIRPKINLIAAYHSHGLYNQAIAMSLEVLKKEPQNHEIYTKLGVSYMFKRDYDNAIDAFRTSIQIRNNNPMAYNNLGVIYLEKKDFDQAIAEFKKAISLNPHQGEFYNNLAKALAMKGMLDEAIAEERKAIGIDPAMAEYHFNLAKLYENKGWFNESIKEYKDALELDPYFFEAHHHLGMVYSRLGNDREAILAFEKAIKINPNSGKTYFMLGINFIKTGDRKKAIWNLEKALQYASSEKDKKAIESTLIKLQSIPQ